MRNLIRVALVVFLVIAFRVASWPGVIVTGCAVYAVSLVFSPYRPCRTCGGSKEHGDIIGNRATGRCWSCGGSGRHPRWGVRWFRRRVYREIRAGRRGRNY